MSNTYFFPKKNKLSGVSERKVCLTLPLPHKVISKEETVEQKGLVKENPGPEPRAKETCPASNQSGTEI